MGYKKCLVIFIDILGSQDRSDYDELVLCIEEKYIHFLIVHT